MFGANTHTIIYCGAFFSEYQTFLLEINEAIQNRLYYKSSESAFFCLGVRKVSILNKG